MAHQRLVSLCGADESGGQVAEQAAVDCLDARRELWDGIYGVMRGEKKMAVSR